MTESIFLRDPKEALELGQGQKTGWFFDQRENRVAAAQYARGRLLDAFSYNGGFALALAPKCDSVEALDVSADAVARITDGDRIAVGGCLFSRTPMALVREILRARRTRLTLVRNLMCTEGEFMMAAGSVEGLQLVVDDIEAARDDLADPFVG